MANEPYQMKPDIDLPEGLYARYGPNRTVIIEDCQNWPWVTIHAGFEGDPAQWQRNIKSRVLDALGIEKVSVSQP